MEQSNNLFELQIDDRSASFLREVAKWSKFLAIVGFIIIGLASLLIAFAGVSLTTGLGGSSSMEPWQTGGLQLLLLAPFLLINFFPCYYILRFANKMQLALRTNDQEVLNTSFGNLKSCFKFLGILTIIVLAMYAIVFAFTIAAAAFI